MIWQPIATYDALKKKPKFAAFYFIQHGQPGPARNGHVGTYVVDKPKSIAQNSVTL